MYKLLYSINGDTMKKRFKYKKKLKRKNFLIFILLISFLLSLNYIEKNINIKLENPSILNTILGSNNTYNYENQKKERITTNIYNFFKKNIFNSPINLLKSEFNYKNNEKTSFNEINFTYKENNKPLIYIYNSHQGEKYSSKYLEDYNIVPDVLMASNMLKDKLENKNIDVIVETSNILDYMKKNNLNHAGSYIASRHFLEMAMTKYPSARLYIDLHRDATTHTVSTATINGKECAKVMFVIGLEYETYENNLKIVTEINNIIKEKYPELTRGILKKQGYGVNGIYNQDLSSNVILIEVGGNENNIEEINNTLDLISEVIGEYIYEKKE